MHVMNNYVNVSGLPEEQPIDVTVGRLPRGRRPHPIPQEFIDRQALLLKRVQTGYEYGFWSFLECLSPKERVLWQQYFPKDPMSGVTWPA